MLFVVADATTVAATYVLADVLRCRLWMHTAWPEQIEGLNNPLPVHFWMLAVLPVVWPFVLGWHRWYEPRWRGWWWLAGRALTASIILVLIASGLALALQKELYPRMQLGFMAVLLPATTLLARSISGLAAQWWGGGPARHVLIVGTDREAVRLRRLLRTMALGRPVVLGHLRLPKTDASRRGRDQTGAVLGDVERLGEILERHVVDEVVFAVPLEEFASVMPYVAVCEEMGVTAALPVRSRHCQSVPSMTHLHGLPLLTYGGSRHAVELLFVKRVLDVLVASIVLLFLWPIMLLCGAAIKVFSPGPALFKQVRSGLNGRPFEMLKFRTMAANAEQRKADVAHLNESDGPVFKSRSDPRITRIGAFLRKYSLDELPQLFNVLRGDMAIVGPRPPLPDEVTRYDRWQRRRLSMRPGLTCLWQIQGRHRLGFEEWMQLDLFYIDHWSLKLDLMILGKTVVTVFSGTGA